MVNIFALEEFKNVTTIEEFRRAVKRSKELSISDPKEAERLHSLWRKEEAEELGLYAGEALP